MSGIEAIESFSGDNRWLSNFWPCRVTLDGLEFDSVEAAYVAAKTMDIGIRHEIKMLSSAGKCKRFGRSMAVRDDWDRVKVLVMKGLLQQKFAANTDLGRNLQSTGNKQIIEGNSWGDEFWGVSDGKGLNTLGLLIMEIRSALTPNTGEQIK